MQGLFYFLAKEIKQKLWHMKFNLKNREGAKINLCELKSELTPLV